MQDKLKIVLVGCGGMSGAWLNVATQMDQVELVGLVDIREEVANKRAEEYSLSEVIIGTDLKSVLHRTKPDVVFDCTVPESHTHITTTALRNGCHVLGEKPMADNMKNAEVSIKAATETGKLYAVIQNRRYNPQIRRLKNFLESGAIGNITTVNCDFYIGAHFGGFRDHMEHVLLVDMAIHTLDAARFISGSDPVSVYCKEWNPKGSWYDHDASAIAVYEMTNDIVYTYRGSWCSEGLHTSWESDWRIIGTKGSVKWDGGDDMTADIVTEVGGFHSKCENVELPPFDGKGRVGGHQGLIHEFIECVQTGGTPETIYTDNIKSLAMVFGAIESSKSGQCLKIEC